MFRRRALVRGAMVGGAAYYAGRKVAQGDQRESEQEMRLQQLEAQQSSPQYAPPPQYAAPPPQYAPAVAPSAPLAPAAPAKSAAEQLMDLKQLLDAGALTQEEFEVEKAKVLRSS